MKPILELLPHLAEPKKIIVTYHHNPDADALGSSLALSHYLNQKGHACQVISPNDIPDFIQWMPGSDEVIIYERTSERAKTFLMQADILFCLDFNQFARTKSFAPLLIEFEGIKVMIDHHLYPDESLDYGISLPSKSSTCEMVYDFINACEDNQIINLDMAQCLYAGLMTDTGSFKFPATTASCHTMVADLMNKGLKTSPIHTAVFDTYKENRLRFLGYVLAEKMIILPEQHAAIIAVSRDELNKFSINTGDTEGIVNFPLSMKNIIFSTFISERESEIRMSFRSKGSMDVNQFARTYFEGGGHLNASGGKSELSLTDTIEKIKQALIEQNAIINTCFNELV